MERKLETICGAILPSLTLILCCLIVAAPGDANAENGFYTQFDTGSSFLGAWAVGSFPARTIAYDVTGGYRFRTNFGLGLTAEHDIWLLNRLRPEEDFPASVFNLGVVADYTFYEDRLRTGVVLGTSTLLVDTAATNGAFSTGLFAEVQSVAVRFALGESWTLEFEPVSFVVTAPVLHDIPLVEIGYRTSVGLEVGF